MRACWNRPPVHSALELRIQELHLTARLMRPRRTLAHPQKCPGGESHSHVQVWTPGSEPGASAIPPPGQVGRITNPSGQVGRIGNPSYSVSTPYGSRTHLACSRDRRPQPEAERGTKQGCEESNPVGIASRFGDEADSQVQQPCKTSTPDGI